MEEETSNLELVAIWSFLAFCILLIKAFFQLLSGGLSQVNESLTPSTDIDFLLIGAALPWLLQLTFVSIFSAVAEYVDAANDESE